MKAYTPEQVREIEDALMLAKDSADIHAEIGYMDQAIATLRSGQDMEVVCQFNRENEFFDTDPPTVFEQSLGWEPLYAIKPSKD
jgi:hypothetical protein